jgi:membrane protein
MNETSQTERSGETIWLRRTARWIRKIWSGEAAELRSSAGTSQPRIRAVEIFLFTREVIAGLMRVAATGRASALAFTTLLSLVPLIAALSQVLRAYFSQIFPELNLHLDTLLNLLLPYQSAQITYQITRAAENAAALSTFGTMIFIVVSFRLFMTVEAVVNLTWKVEGSRSYRQKLRAFTMLFFWGPIVIGLSLATSSTFEMSPFVGRLLASELVQFMIEIGTFFVAFTMLFWLVPATRVRIRSAAFGAGVTTALFELVRAGLGLYSKWLFQGTMNVIYGTLGLLVLFLVALEVMWLVVLLGVEVSFVHQNFRGILRASTRSLTDDPRFDVYFGLLALGRIVRRYRCRDAAPRTEQLAHDLGATDEQIVSILRRLEEANIVRELSDPFTGWLPASDPDGIRLEEVMRELENGGHRRVPAISGDEPGEAIVRELLGSLDSASAAALGERRLGDLVREIYGDSDPGVTEDDATRQRADRERTKLEKRDE